MIICDTGPLVAALNADDKQHVRCRDLLLHGRRPLIVPAPVLTEVCYLAGSRLGSNVEAAFLQSLATRELILEPTTARDLARMAALVRTYGDFPLGTVDASVIAVAERLNATTIATLDHRHFRAVRPNHCDAFDLVPPRPVTAIRLDSSPRRRQLR
jgi:predicted nucleic acid-binding protein